MREVMLQTFALSAGLLFMGCSPETPPEGGSGGSSAGGSATGGTATGGRATGGRATGGTGTAGRSTGGSGGAAHPGDAVTYGGHWYRFTQASIGGAEAQADCVALGGYLVCIETQAENTFVLSLAGSARPWIGLNDERVVGTYVWVNGSPVNYQNWQSGQPDNISTERWVKLNADGTWDDAVNPSSYICEWDR